MGASTLADGLVFEGTYAHCHGDARRGVGSLDVAEPGMYDGFGEDDLTAQCTGSLCRTWRRSDVSRGICGAPSEHLVDGQVPGTWA